MIKTLAASPIRFKIGGKVGKAITPDFDMYSYNRHYYYGYNYGPYYGYDGYSYSPYYSQPHVFRGGQYNRYFILHYTYLGV